MGQPSAPSDLQRIVLVVSEDSALRGALEFLLRVEGFSVRGVGSGEALRAAPLPGSISCLIVDHHSRGPASGLAAVQAIRRRRAEVPIILIVAGPTRRLRAAAVEARCELVEKPPVGSVLIDALRRALQA